MIQKWKRKKAAVPEVAEPEEMSPLALSLLEQFSMGMSGPSVQAIALAATKSGAAGPGIAELASLGNHGRASQHIASQMVLKYCQSPDINLPVPYMADVPVLVKTPNDWQLSTRPVGLYLPHEWFAWLQDQEKVSGLENLAAFWAEHSKKDPKLKGNPMVAAPCLQKDIQLCPCVFTVKTFFVCLNLRRADPNFCLCSSMAMEEHSSAQTAC